MTDNRTTALREKLTERGVKYTTNDHMGAYETSWNGFTAMQLTPSAKLIMAVTPEQAIAATLGRPKAKSHPYGYEPDTGAFDCTRCECGCINDISATYCNDCGGEIEIDMYAEKEIYHTLRHLVFAEKHDDGSLEFGGKRYVAATLGSGTLTAAQVCECVEKHWHDLSDEYDMPEATALPEYSYDWQAIADELNAAVGNGTCHMDFIDEYERPSGDEDYLCECSECGGQMWEPAHDLPLYCRKCGKKVEQ